MIPGPAQWVKGSGIATAAAQSQPLAWELPDATGEMIKKKKEKKRKKRKKERKSLKIKQS